MMDNAPEAITYAVAGLITGVLNVVEIVLILRTKNRKTFDKLLLSLAVSDALVGITAAVYKMTKFTLKDTTILMTQHNFANFLAISIIFSITFLLAITIDRFLAVRFPIKHRMVATNRRVNIAIIALWLLSVVSATSHSLFTFVWAKKITLFAATGTLIAFGVGLIATYVAIFCLINKRCIIKAKRDRDNLNVAIRQVPLFSKENCSTERSVLITGCVVTISFIICTYPFAFEFLIKKSVYRVSFPAKLMIALNSLINPFIYFFKSYIVSRGRKRVTEAVEMS